MYLSKECLKEKKLWEAAGIVLPQFDIDAMRAKTNKQPIWLHFGSGNIFRGFLAALQQKLLDNGAADTGIIAAESFDFEIIEKIYKPNDELSLLVTLNPDGAMDKKVIASVADSIIADSGKKQEWTKLVGTAVNPSLKMISFTITEKGYNLKTSSGEFLPDVQADLENGPNKPRNVIAIVTSLLYERYKAACLPIAVVSMDNCSHNGEKLQTAVLTLATLWAERGFVDNGFIQYLSDGQKVSFPCSMIDKITPAPSLTVKLELEKVGFENTQMLRTSKNTSIAPFVNAEAPQYLVIEDKFPNGHPPLQPAGVIFADKETVEKVERMKLCTCLNPLHTSLAVFGCLLGYTSIAEEMKNSTLKKLVCGVGRTEGMAVVADPGIISPTDFINEVIEKRLPNPFMPDTPQRIAMDTSQKIPNRFGNTIRLYTENPSLDVTSLTYIPLVIAGWCRYLLGIDDSLEKFELSRDPMLDELQCYLKNVQIGNPESVKDSLQPILSNTAIFGVDLYKVSLGAKVEGYFKEMITGKDAVKNLLQKIVG